MKLLVTLDCSTDVYVWDATRTSRRCLCEVRRRFSQDVALHLHTRKLRAQPADLHLLGAHQLAVGAGELARALGLDPVEQRLIDHAQGARAAAATL